MNLELIIKRKNEFIPCILFDRRINKDNACVYACDRKFNLKTKLIRCSSPFDM